MFPGIRTPTKKISYPNESLRNTDSMEEPASSQNINMRHSTGEQETGNKEESLRSPPPSQAGHKYTSKVAEARACIVKAKTIMTNTRNLKTDVKVEVTKTLDRLYQIVKEVSADSNLKEKEEINPGKDKENGKHSRNSTTPKGNTEENSTEDKCRILEHLEKQSRILEENSKKLDELKDKLEHQHQLINSKTYAEITAIRPAQLPSLKNTLHTVIITSQNEEDTGEQVLTRVRDTVDAKEGWVKVERTRKGKDRKVIMSCGSEEDRQKIKQKLESAGKNLIVEEVKNKDPLLILRDVLSVNTDEDIVKAFRNQNKGIFQDINGTDDKIQIRYRRKARNPHTCHIVVSTSPTIWRRAVETGAIYIDLQRIRVADQSPLVQCMRCLGYGHSKKFCTEPTDSCSHCGGPHLRVDCTEWKTGSVPTCTNCKTAKQQHCDHNAFSEECPTRKKRDAIARMAVAYC